MCGIAGYYSANVSDVQLQSVLTLLKHRGPDDQDFFRQKDVGLIHTRLSIIELSPLGAQPYKFENLVLVFNGELYNYKEVRSELIELGYFFVSNSDTEVLIKAFHCWKEKSVDRFIGMFAFSIYDLEKDEIYLFRDRVGVKPLYYSYQNSSLIFASELKALSCFDHSREINLDAVSLYFRFGFVPHPYSIYSSVAKLEPGHYIRVTRNGFSKHRFWEPRYEIVHGRSEEDWMDELEATMISAFRYRMVSDVPVGVFLSGGIDSSLLTAILQKHHGGMHSFTIGFKETAFDESSYAEQVASYLGTNHTQKILRLDEAKKRLMDFYSIYDEPFADTSGIPTSCVTELARNSGMKVVLSADGGDELFGGYTHYQKALKLFQNFSALSIESRRALAKTSRTLLPARLRKKIYPLNIEHKAYAFEELISSTNAHEFFENFLANQSMDEIVRIIHSASAKAAGTSQNGLTDMQSMMAWDFNHYLPEDLLTKVDRATMFHSLECRDPLLDHRLVEIAMTIPDDLKVRDGKGKYILRRLLSRYIPEQYFERKKQGFSIPIFAWFGKELDLMFKEFLSPENLKEVPFLDATEIHHEYKKYLYYKKRGKEYNIEKMWRILSLMLWWEKYMRHGG